jgi:uncharacterized membrane-anchored protein YitT (DUF2179 family)
MRRRDFINIPDASSLKRIFFIVAGVVMTTYGLKGFLLQRGLIDGGVTGVALLVSQITPLPMALWVLLINIPAVLLGSTQVGKEFAARSVAAVILLALGIYFIDFPLITHDIWLISAFGGFFVGGGMGLVMRGGAIIDGTEVISIFLSRKNLLSSSDISLLLNIIIFILGAYLFDIETALYSILTYFSGSKTMEYFVEGFEEYIGVTIVTDKPEEMKNMIVEKMGRGVTLYHGTMGYGKRGKLAKETDIIYSVITRLELSKLQFEINQVDSHAFVSMSSVYDTRGGMIKKKKRFKP